MELVLETSSGSVSAQTEDRAKIYVSTKCSKLETALVQA